MDSPSTYKNKAEADADMRRRKWREFKSVVYLWVYGVFYGVLFKVGLGWKFNKWLCSIGKYRKFPGGRCQWCGIVH